MLGRTSALRRAAGALLQQPVQHARGLATADGDIALLEQLLSAAKARATEESAKVVEEDDATGPKFVVGTYNAISSVGLETFPTKGAPAYKTASIVDNPDIEPHAIMLRSHKLQVSEVPDTIRAIARCGAGTNNVPVDEMSARGIPVFNSPGANANAVKELVVCSMLLASRGVVEGIDHVKTIFEEDGDDVGKVKKRVEAEKKLFKGREIQGKTLGVIGLGHIGASVAEAALALGMNIVGYDPAISVEGAWRLPGGNIKRADSVDDLMPQCDYISLHVPYMEATHHILGKEQLEKMRPGAALVNFARGELVDSAALRAIYDSGAHTGKYVSDFADEWLHDCEKVIIMPHLGASTAEAEDNSATMAAQEVIDFVATGTITNSVNFPTTKLESLGGSGTRVVIVNRNEPGILGAIASVLGNSGVNIQQQINTSRGSIAYNVVDVDQEEPDMVAAMTELRSLDGVLSTRLIGSKPEFKVPSNYVLRQ